MRPADRRFQNLPARPLGDGDARSRGKHIVRLAVANCTINRLVSSDLLATFASPMSVGSKPDVRRNSRAWEMASSSLESLPSAILAPEKYCVRSAETKS